MSSSSPVCKRFSKISFISNSGVINFFASSSSSFVNKTWPSRLTKLFFCVVWRRLVYKFRFRAPKCWRNFLPQKFRPAPRSLATVSCRLPASKFWGPRSGSSTLPRPSSQPSRLRRSGSTTRSFMNWTRYHRLPQRPQQLLSEVRLWSDLTIHITLISVWKRYCCILLRQAKCRMTKTIYVQEFNWISGSHFQEVLAGRRKIWLGSKSGPVLFGSSLWRANPGKYFAKSLFQVCLISDVQLPNTIKQAFGIKIALT